MSMSIGLGIGIGKRRDILAGWSIGAAATDIDFASRRVASNGRPRSFDAFMAYNAGSGFSRASAAYDQRLSDPLVIDPYAADAPRLRGDGLLIGPAATRLSLNPQNPQAWINDGATLTNLAADGQWSPLQVASAGSASHGVRVASVVAFTSGTPVSIRVRYKPGTSGRFRVNAYNMTTTNTSVVSGPTGSIASLTTLAGAWSNINNVAVGGGLYDLEATFTPNGSANHIVSAGPDSATAGQNVIVYGGQVTNTPYPREWILGTAGSTQAVAQDVLRYTATQVGAVASEGSAFIRLTALGYDPANFTRAFAFEQGSGTLSRIQAYVGTDGKGNVRIYDDANTAVASYTTAASVVGVDAVFGITWGGGSCRMKIGSDAAANDASAPSPTAISTLTIGSTYNNVGALFGRVRRYENGNRRLSDAEFDATFARLAA